MTTVPQPSRNCHPCENPDCRVCCEQCVPVKRVAMRKTATPGVRRLGLDDEREAGGLAADHLDHDALSWIIAEVTAGREGDARMIMRRKGFGTCLPIRRVMRRASRHSRPEWRSYPILPGYLFVGMSDETPGWRDLMQPSFVHGVVGFAGQPAALDKQALDRFVARYHTDFYPRPETDAWVSPFKAGDHVRVMTGPFEGHVVPVLKVRQEQAVVLINVLGKGCEVAFGLDSLGESRA